LGGFEAVRDKDRPAAVRRDSAGWAAQRLRSTAFQAWAVHVCLVHAVAAVAVWLSPGRDAVRPQMDGIANYLIAPFALWDGGWYTRIVEGGYDETKSTAAFWPLYPMLVRLVGEGTRWSPETAGVLVSHLAFLGALLVLHRLVRDRYGEEIATRSIWLLALSPVAFFFSAFYTEALFLFLSVSAIWLARTSRWTWAAPVLGLAALTRSTGVLVAVPVGLALIRRWRETGNVPWRPGIQIAAAAATPLVFAAHLDRIWGEPLLMFRVQERWERAFALPWQSLRHGIRGTELRYVNARYTCADALSDLSWRECRDAAGLPIDSISDDLSTWTAVVALLLAPLLLRWLDTADSLYGAALFTVPLLSGIPSDPLVSLPRYLLVAYPFFVVLAMLTRNRRLFVGTLVVSTALLIWLLSVFTRAWFVA
jgi:hypothetical protein